MFKTSLKIFVGSVVTTEMICIRPVWRALKSVVTSAVEMFTYESRNSWRQPYNE